MPTSRKIIFIFLALFLCFTLSPLASPIIKSGSAYGWWRPHWPPHRPPHPPQEEPDASAPEPTTWLLIGSGVAGLVLLRKKFQK